MTDETPEGAPAAPPRTLSPAAQRALAEAQERREKAEAARQQAATEHNGRGGLDPVRYGDWEIKGLTSDF
ncbi:MAG: hypothetical protein JWN93_689 [Hyphomicrobiales bacterium]|jgi:hypothetical protein|nr:hypothetical protein [Hyphomicrobiales bacterium]